MAPGVNANEDPTLAAKNVMSCGPTVVGPLDWPRTETALAAYMAGTVIGLSRNLPRKQARCLERVHRATAFAKTVLCVMTDEEQHTARTGTTSAMCRTTGNERS